MKYNPSSMHAARVLSLAALLLLITCFPFTSLLALHVDASEIGAASLLQETNPSSATPTSTYEVETTTLTPSQTSIITITPSTLTPTVTESLSVTISPAPSSTETPTTTLTPPPASTPYSSQSMLINEIAWAGTHASANDEWIELFNNSSTPINLSGWLLTDGGDINITLTGNIAAKSFFLLERTDNSTIATIAANMIYTGSLNNSGEILRIKDPSGSIIDRANGNGGSWPAGESSTRSSMERLGTGDHWSTFSGSDGNGQDAAGNAIRGTPGQPNSPPSPPASPTPEASLTPTPEVTSPPNFPPLSVMINEVAWAGTVASASDEWIELYNPGTTSITLSGWVLTDGGDINLSLSGKIEPNGYFLLERTDDNAVANISADLIYSGGLSNSGETLWLKDPTGVVVDSANSFGSVWPAGSSSIKASMEREGGIDRAGNWETFTGYFGTGNDAAGNPIKGTPRHPNSLLFPIPAPTWVPGAIRINEVLIRPHFDWEGKGRVDTGDEFIEIINLGPRKVFLKGWYLDDIADGGSSAYKIKGVTLKPGSKAAFFRSETHIALNDGGDTVRLLAPNGNVVDKISYLKVRAYNLSYGRLPDGSGHLAYGLWPTPGESNFLFDDHFIPATGLPIACPEPGIKRMHFMRHARHPAQERWLEASGFGICD